MHQLLSLIKQQKKLFTVFVAILVLACVTRFYNLGVTPHGMTWDEAAIGYNGFAILHTRRDEWLQRLPVSFKSFGDYKAPLAIYGNGVFTYVFGMNLFAVRLPFALSGIATVAVLYLLTRQLLSFHKRKEELSLLVMFLLTTSPWHLHFSRVGFESGLSLFLLLIGLLFLHYILHTKRSLPIAVLNSAAAAISFALSVYAYHSAKIVMPLLVVSFLLLHLKKLKSHLLELCIAAGVGLVVLKPFIEDAIWGKGLERAGVTIFSTYPLQEVVPLTLKQLLIHLSPGFMILGDTTTLRHGDGVWGVVFPTVYVFMLMGLLAGFYLYKTSKQYFMIYTFSVLWLIIGLLPAAITTDIPHSNRALLALPGMLLLAVIGFDVVVEKIQSIKDTLSGKQNKEIFFKLTVGTLLLLHSFYFVAYLRHYFTVYAAQSSEDFQDGYIEALSIAKEYEKGLNNKKEVDKILFTSEYGQPYIYTLFVRKTDPIWYQGGALVKYEFTDKITVGDLERDNVLVVGGKSSDLPIEKATHVVRGSDNEIRFKMYLTKDK